MYSLLLDLAIEPTVVRIIRQENFLGGEFSLINPIAIGLVFFSWFWLYLKVDLVIDISSDSYRIKHSG